MRMPSTPSPWPALLASFALHAVVVLAAWCLVASQTRVPLTVGACVEEPTDHLALSIIFDSVAKVPPPAQMIDTHADEPPATDTGTELIASREFNPIISPPAAPPVVKPVPAAVTQPGAATRTNAGGSDSGSPSNGQRARGAGEQPFFPAIAKARSIVYLIDRSASMGHNEGAFNRASTEVVSSLRQLPPDALFQVVVYNDRLPVCLVAPDKLRLAQPEIVAQFIQAINDPRLLPEGNTNHVAALRYALSLNPDAIFWVTDGDGFSPRDLIDVTRANHAATAIHLVEMSGAGPRDANHPIVQLTQLTRGTYHTVRAGPGATAIPGLVQQ